MPTKYLINGGRPLSGVVRLDGAKNAVTKQLVASLLTDEPCTLHNVPKNQEVFSVLEMLSELGMESTWLGEDSLLVQTKEIKNIAIKSEYSGTNRIPILVIGPLLYRAQEAFVPMAGGCNIGSRPVDFHVNALRAFGAEITENEDGYHAKSSRIQGCVIELPYPSVGATENILLTAVLATGTTVIKNAAVEPEIIDTILLLQKMGALVHIDTDRKIIIEGVEKLAGANHNIIPDRIEAASFAIAAIVTNGHLEIQNARQSDMISLLNVVRKVGGGFDVGEQGITFFRSKSHLSCVHVETDVFPGFSTDWQPMLVSLLTQSEGVSVIHETVYENRFGYTQMLRDMGANISLSKDCLGSKSCRFLCRGYQHSCIVHGLTILSGRKMQIPDLRAGFAYVVAALIANGESEISGIKYLERGYAKVVEKLKLLGAKIEEQ